MMDTLSFYNNQLNVHKLSLDYKMLNLQNQKNTFLATSSSVGLTGINSLIFLFS